MGKSVDRVVVDLAQFSDLMVIYLGNESPHAPRAGHALDNRQESAEQ